MQELFRFETDDFELRVWCSDVSTRQKTHHIALEKRRLALDSALVSADKTSIERDRETFAYLSPPVFLNEVAVAGELKVAVITPPKDTTAKLGLGDFLFFENTQYQFEWTFSDSVEVARLNHKGQLLNDCFRFVEGRKRSAPRLFGVINTGNDVGWMRLPLVYEIDGKSFGHDFSFEILPTKVDLHTDLPEMYRSIDEAFPLWRFRLVEKTEQEVSRGDQRGDFPLLWLANFGHLREQFEHGLKVISHAPHSRLKSFATRVKAQRLKGKLSNRLAERVRDDLSNRRLDRRYRIEKKVLSVDTAENRFVKMAVSTCKSRLGDFEEKLREANLAPENQRLSDGFLDELHCWQKPLKTVLEHSFFKDVGSYSSHGGDSLVLQQKAGYSTVYRVWQDLKYYLDAFGGQANVSMKSIAEVYEIWCFLTVKNILVTELGFRLTKSRTSELVTGDYLEKRLIDGFSGAFEFKHADGAVARLAHEPVFGKQGKRIRSFLVTQKPDIVLEVKLPAPLSKKFIWLFDAKYRIKQKNEFAEAEGRDGIDYVPDDAINQMHRYRDALIHISDEKGLEYTSKSRPVLGAFALYPGCFNQEEEINPYADSISEIAVGAFSMLPSALDQQGSSKCGHFWLSQFLKEQLSGAADRRTRYSAGAQSESFFVQEAARIPYHGMRQVLYPDLVLAIALGHAEGRAEEYFSAFLDGTAQWYHHPRSVFDNKFSRHVVKEIRYLALAANKIGEPSKSIERIWPVKEVALVKRSEISVGQAGKASNSDELYYLFALGKPLALHDPVVDVPPQFLRSMKLTTLGRLETSSVFSGIESVYDEAFVT